MVEIILAYNLKTGFFPDMQFSHKDIANYGASVKAQKVYDALVKMPKKFLDKKFIFQNPAMLLFSIYNKISSCKKLRKPTE